MARLTEFHRQQLRSVKYQQALRRYHERNVRPREFHVGDLVLRQVQGSNDRH
jgi:hypothetical protein